jgi:vitamin B12 transporter
VIQIFTRGYRSGAAGGGSATAEVAGYGQRAASATVHATVADTPISASFGARHVGGVSAIDPASVQPTAFQPTATVNPDRDGVEQRSASLRAAHHAGEGGDLEATILHTDNRLRFDQVQPVPDADEREHSRLDTWQAHWQQRWGDRLSTRVALGGSLQTSRDDVAASGTASTDYFRATNQQATLQADLTLAERVNLQVGAESLRQRGGATAYDPTGGGTRIDHDRDVSSAWIGTVGAFGPNHLQLNVRRDDYNDVGGATTGLAAYGRELASGLRVTAQVSTAFRAPSFNDLYYPFFGNPDLRPERAKSLEFGLRYARDAERASVAVYRTLTHDLIAFDPATSRSENIARAQLEGIEFAAATRRGAWQLGGSVTLGRAIDADTRLRLVRRAASVVNLDTAWNAGPVRLGAAFTRSAGRTDLDLNTFDRKALPAYERTRLLAAWQVTRTLALRARIENLFDQRTQLVDGYGTFGRFLAVGVQADW